MQHLGLCDHLHGDGGLPDHLYEKHPEKEDNQKRRNADHACAEAPLFLPLLLLRWEDFGKVLGQLLDERRAAVDALLVLGGDDPMAGGTPADRREADVAIGAFPRTWRILPAADHAESERLRAGFPFFGVEVCIRLHRFTSEPSFYSRASKTMFPK